MMNFALGYIAGIATATLIVATLTFFRRVIENRITVVEKMIENAGPRPRGFIIEPPDEAEEARARIIAQNKLQGKDTPLSDLI